jgi:translation initiation factor eIF-2B subunit epsilon
LEEGEFSTGSTLSSFRPNLIDDARTTDRRHPESPIFLVDAKKGHLLHYTQNPLMPPRSRFPIPSSLILDTPAGTALTFEVWSGPSNRSSSSAGYRDLGVDVCEADVPALFTENFDWNDLRRHLVAGVLGSELLGKKIGIKTVGDLDESRRVETNEEVKQSGVSRGMGKGRYIDRVRDTRTFADIS